MKIWIFAMFVHKGAQLFLYGSNADFKATFMEFDGHEIGI